ncbi:cytochrome o ubiquinol oxidase subunit IV [Sphingomonas sp.]|uniref:cytochrome o ubiquinol oxidase subunit IV n=1 Tax=Sphingomonas sp. TaxID=28214 RepID=UPI002C323600|nr:cytochrome o ubiquinol oxidase subunit IV [Sphingomonas sp.]HWK36438.1 cytochrome o ubiquinol oxidase subunit IV [Sphingomonas sp.]
MSADASHANANAHGSRRSYLLGFLLSVVLTAVPFWLVMTGAIADAATTAALVVVLAIVQILVHTVFFLHVNPRAEGGWTLMAYAFTAVLVVICIGGSLWIMHHLNLNMMPITGTEMSNQP